MKKTLRKLSFLSALVVCFILAIPAFVPVAKLIAAPVTYQVSVDGLVVEGFADTGIVGEEYTIANGTIGGGNAEVVVKNPYGQEISTQNGKFTPTTSGNYTVIYTYNQQETALTVKVSAVAKGMEIAFEENTSNIIPAIINPEKDGQALTLNLPTPYVVNKDGEKVDGAVVETTVKFSGEGTNYTYVPATSDAPAKLTLDKTQDGKYTLTYKYYVASKLVAFTQKTIKADKTYDNDFEFTFDFNSVKPTTAEIGKETKLPTVVAQNKDTKDEVEVYYSVKAEITVGENKTTYTPADANNDVLTFKDGAFYFTPVKEGDYVITYSVKDVFGRDAAVSSSSFEINDVEDSIAPTPVVVMPYTATDIANGTLDYTDALELLATKTSAENILIMPIWADDAANGIVEDNLTLYRTVKKASGTEVFNESTNDLTKDGSATGKILVFNSTLDLTGDANSVVLTLNLNGKAVEITKSQVLVISTSTAEDALTGGTYTISYIADDKAGNGIITEPYSMVIEAGFEDTEAPTIDFEEQLPTAIFLDEEVSFKVEEPVDSVDRELSSYVAYKLNDEATEIRADAESSIISYDEDSKTYTLIVSDNTVEKVEVIAYAQDDSGNIGKKSQTVIVLNTGDSALTTITNKVIDITQANGYTQGAEIILPTITYNDDLVEYLNVDIRIESGNIEFTAYDAEITKTANTLTLANAKFIPSLAGKYKITYISTDAANNKTITVFTIDIAANVADFQPEFKGLPAEINNGKIEKGEKTALPIPTVDLSDTTLKIKDGKYRVVVTGPTGYELTSNYFFTANKTGNYTIQYVADILNEDDTPFTTIYSKEYKVEVVDETGPVFTEDSVVYIKNFFAELNAQGSITKGTKVNIPLPTWEGDDIDLSASYVIVTTPNTSGTEYYLNDTDDLAKLADYAFNRDATFTITYVLVDKLGNETKETVTLDVGDVEPPVITVEDGLLKEEYKIGDTLTIDLSKITAIDKVDGEILTYNEQTKKYSIKDDAKITITVTNTTTGTALTNDVTSIDSDLNFQFTIETAGEYSVKIEISDTVGKVGTYDDLGFVVTEDANAGMSAEEVLGTVLIIISVLMLAGVIVYFIVSKKKSDKKWK